jgi:putative phosphoribosyl transferase
MRATRAMATGKLIEEPQLRNKTHVVADRSHAGMLLAAKLKSVTGADSIILAIPAGGVPVAAVIATQLRIPLEVAVIRKLHIPWNREAGFGALSWDGTVLFNEPLLKLLGLTREEIEQCIAEERAELERRMQLFRKGKPFPDLTRKQVIVVDDGLASGFTMLVALRSIKLQRPRELIVAVPTASLSALKLVSIEADRIICLNVREGRAFAVADAYNRWYDLRTEDVVAILEAAGYYNTSKV